MKQNQLASPLLLSVTPAILMAVALQSGKLIFDYDGYVFFIQYQTCPECGPHPSAIVTAQIQANIEHS